MPASRKTDLATMQRRVIARLAAFGMLEMREIEHLASMGGELREFVRDDVILSEENRGPELQLLLDGWAASAVALSNGSRQIVTVNLPGDLLGVPGLGVHRPLDSVIALGPVTVCSVQVSKLWDLFEAWPKLAARLFLVAQEERVMAMERLALVGKAPALSRVAAMFIRFGERLARLGWGTAESYDFPLFQKDMADLVGVTPVHLNGLLRDLKESGLITLDNRHVCIRDEPALRKLAQIDPWQFSPPAFAGDA